MQIRPEYKIRDGIISILHLIDYETFSNMIYNRRKQLYKAIFTKALGKNFEIERF